MDPSLIEADLGWKAKITPAEIVQRMYEDRLI
jgi:nucleoside-diphosphate-sugar epimerase